jgi:hypothetical protein
MLGKEKKNGFLALGGHQHREAVVTKWNQRETPEAPTERKERQGG